MKQALEIGAQKAVDKLGKSNGFLKDPDVKIPMPDKLQKVEKLMRRYRMEKYADEFVTTMNRAAEKSVKSTLSIFVDAIKAMTFVDAVKIYQGREDEATRYFRNKKCGELHNTIKPIVKSATQSVGATKAYKKFSNKVATVSSSTAKQMPDLDEYVTEKTLDGLFKKIAEQESMIRLDPKARTTELLQEVFGK